MTPDFLAGYLSGCASIVVGNPLDLLKVRLQSQPHPPSQSQPVAPGVRGALRRVSPTAAGGFKSGKPALGTLVAGLPGPLLTYGFLNAVLFSSYTRALSFSSSSSSSSSSAAAPPTYTQHFFAGCIAGLATLPISCPTELVKCRVQAGGRSRTLPYPSSAPAASRAAAPPSSSSYKTALHIHKHAGLRGFFTGATITALRDSLGYGFYFAGYELGKSLYDRRFPRKCKKTEKSNDNGRAAAPSAAAAGKEEEEEEEKEHGGRNGGGCEGGDRDDAAKILLCGGFAGVLTWASVYPLDVVKTRVQTRTTSGSQQRRGGGGTPRLGAWATARRIYNQEGGLRVFKRGMGLCCARAFVVNAAQWSVYEWCVKLLA